MIINRVTGKSSRGLSVRPFRLLLFISTLVMLVIFTVASSATPANAAALLADPWSQLGADIDGEATDDRSGEAVSLSADGSRMAVGAYQNDGNGVDAGHVRVYEFGGTAWSQLGADIDGEATLDQSGTSVSLSSDGSRVAIGAPANDGSDADAGHVRVYEYNGAAWNQLGADIDGEAQGDRSGTSVSLSANGSRVAIGAPDNDGTAAAAGHVRIYEYNGATWSQLGADIDGEAWGDDSGEAVSLSADGSRVAIGAPYNDESATNAGHVRVYEYDGVAWSQLGADIDGEATYDFSGEAVSLSPDGSRVAMGARLNGGNGSNAGHVRVYEYDGVVWSQLGADIDSEAAGDQLGVSASLSSDGSRVAIGAPLNDGNNLNSGQVRVYEYDGSAWNQVGADIDGEAALDRFGLAVSLSSDGSRVAAGTSSNNGGGSLAGHARVFTAPTTTLAIALADFHAQANGDLIEFTWQTATESGVAGFYVVGITESGEERISGEMVASPVIDSVTPTDYQFSATTDAVSFYLDEMRIDGSVERHGPFEIFVTSVKPNAVPRVYLPLVVGE